MCTIPDHPCVPDRLHDRLANARITRADGAALIALLELIAACTRAAQAAVDRVGPDPDRQANYQVGAWSALVDRYQDIIGGAR